MALSGHIDLQADASLDPVPAAPGVVLIELSGAEPYLGRAQNMRRRIGRVLARPGIRELAVRALFQPVGSSFEASLAMYQAGRDVWRDDCRRRLRLRTPPFLKLHLENEFPRSSVVTRLSGRRALFFGPFRSRAVAEQFESALLDHFLVRRCVENLEPAADHPGCVYGEMGKCLRPCQLAVDVAEYRAESGRLLETLTSDGQALGRELERRRDEASSELEFEEAARRHREIQDLKASWRLGEDLARDLDRLHGVIVQPAAEPGRIALFPFFRGFFQERVELSLEMSSDRPGSLDNRVQEALDASGGTTGGLREREEHQALLRRWAFSSFRRGEMVLIDRWDRPPIRRLVNAVSRVASGRAGGKATTAAMRRQERERQRLEVAGSGE